MKGSPLKYKINNLERFFAGFYQLVDTKVDYSDFLADPWVTKSEYFGKLKWGEFTIYQVRKSLLNRNTFLRIKGHVDANELTLEISYHQGLVVVISYLGMIVFSLILLRDNFYIGLGFLLVIFVQLFFQIRHYYKRKKDFINKIEAIIQDN